MRLLRTVSALAVCLSIGPWARASTLITTSSSPNVFYSATRFHVHFAGGHYWVALHNGTQPRLWSSPDGVTWTDRGSIFSSFNPANAGRWAVRYSGSVVIAFGYNGADTNRYYRKGVLNGNGTVTWNAADAGVTGVTGTADQELNALIADGKPVLWRAGPANADAGRFTFGNQLDAPVSWVDGPAPPPLSTATGGGFSAGAIFPAGGSDPDDLVVLRLTASDPHTPGNHRLVSIDYDAGGAGFDPAWYNVSLLGGALTEGNATESTANPDVELQRQLAAVRDSSGRLHAVYINRNNDAAHYRKEPGLGGAWSRVTADATQAGAVNVLKVALTAAPNDQLYLWYEKEPNSIFYRRFDGTTWGPEAFLYTAPIDLRQALGAMESLGPCSLALAWTENSVAPFEVRISLQAAPCPALGVSSGASTLTVTAPGSFELVFDEATGGGIRVFHDLAEDPSKSFDLAAGPASHENLFIDEVRVAGVNYRTDQNDSGARVELLEATPTRVVVRQESFYEDNGSSNQLASLKGRGDYAVYPSGKMALDWTRRATSLINYETQELQHSVHYRDPGNPPFDGWSFYVDDGALAGSSPIPPSKTFSLYRSDLPGQMTTDFLHVLSQDWAQADATTLGTNDAQERAEISWRENDPGSLPDGSLESWAWLSYFKPTSFLDHADAAVTERRDDYRSPDGLAILVGGPWNHASESSSGDDFNEAEAAYVLTLDPSLGLTFRIDGAATNRHDPVFKIRQWRSLQDPTSVSLNGVALANDVDFRADVKPVARAHFAQDLTWYSTLQSGSEVTAPDVGSAGTVANGNDFPAGRFGNGARFDADGEFLSFPSAGNFDPAEGAIEFWYRPSFDYGSGPAGDDNGFFGYYVDANNYFYAWHEPYLGGAGTGEGIQFDIAVGGVLFSRAIGAGPAAPVYWRSNEWVHLRFLWKSDPTLPRLEVYLNGDLIGPPPTGGYATPAPVDAAFYIGDRERGNAFTDNAKGIIDEFRVYSTADAPRSLARGGLDTDAGEYLASGTRNLDLAFSTLDGAGRGEYLYFGSDSQFRGLNVALETDGVGTGLDLRWEFWNGSDWADLESGFSFTDGTNQLTRSGTIHWTDPFGWSPYSLIGGPELFYVRASLVSGSYSTAPVEGIVKTDILLFQYCGILAADDQTFAFGPAVPTAVDLVSFTAAGGNGFVELLWETASELDNLGFHLHRSRFENGPFERITSSVIPGLGSSPAGARYRHRDEGLPNGVTLFYRLEDVDSRGAARFHGPVAAAPQEGGAAPGDGSKSRMVYGNPDRTEARAARHGNRISIELRTAGFEAEPVGDGSVILSVPGFEEVEGGGGLSLPVERLWLDAVAGRRVEILSARAEELERFSGLVPAASNLELRANPRGSLEPHRSRRRRPREGEALVPGDWARIASVGFQGGRKKAQLELSPLRWDPSRGEVLLARRLVVEVSFAARDPEETARGRRPRGVGSRSSAPAAARIATRERGLVAVRFEDLFGRRGPGIPISSLRLSRQGTAVRYHLEPDADRFAPGSRLFFFSEGASLNPYGEEAVYEIHTGLAGEVMEVDRTEGEGPGAAQVLHRLSLEENRYYQAGLLDATDLWLWDVVPAPGRKSFSFEVEELAPAGGSGRLFVRLQGTSDLLGVTDHHVRVYVNGSLAGESSWDGKKARDLEAEIPAGLLIAGENHLEIENAGDTGAAYSMIMLDRFEVSYPRRPVAVDGRLEGVWERSGLAEVSGLGEGALVLDVTGEAPRWISHRASSSGTLRFAVQAGRRYLAVAPHVLLRPETKPVPRASLRSEANQADHLIVAPESFVPALGELARLRQDQGLRVKIVTLESVFSEFGFGEPRPAAIRDFLAYAYHQWREPAIRYVLLVGDATYDFKNHLGTGAKSHLPAMVVPTAFLWTASDPAYAAVNGDDVLPDISIGRLPAASVAELEAMVEKIVAYESDEAGGPGGIVLVADDPDEAGDFEADARELAAGVLSSWNPRRILLRELGPDGTREAIREALAGDASLLSYLGHGGIHLWAHENVFDLSDVAALGETLRQPILLTMNCLNGYFHFPYFDSLGEAMVKARGKGAVAAFSPSGLSLNGPAHVYHQALLRELFSKTHHRLGDAILAAQETYAASGELPDLLRIYHLLGDPALRIR